MTVRDIVFQAAERLAQEKPFDRITFAEIAEAAGVHWTAVRRHFGSKQQMREWLKERQSAPGAELADTRSRVLDAAAHIFATGGYMNSSLDKVAEAAGLSKGAVYWHFSGKQDLFLAVLEQQYERQLRQLDRQIKLVLSAEDPTGALADWLEAQFACLEPDGESSMLFLEFVLSARDPKVRARLQKLHAGLMDGVGTLLQAMQREGYLSEDADPHSLALLFDALLKGVLMEWIIDPQTDRRQKLVRTISQVLWHGLPPKK